MAEVALLPASRATQEVAHILDDVFTLCRIPFVYDFIFTADPVADISILTAPVQNEHAIAARITVSGTETTASYAHVFDFSCDTFFCSVPAFSVGAVTVGFATQERASDASHAALNASVEHVSCARYVRDDERGVILMLSENPATGITEVDCMSHRSTRKRTRVCARFHTNSLHSNLKSTKGVLHPDDLAEALSYLNVSYERRACPMCMMAGSGECGCVLPFRRPAHPLDFRNERGNMRLHTGLYQGGCTVRLFNDALPCVITSLSTRSVIRGSLDRRVVSRLTKYAVQDRMSKLKVNPFSPVASLPTPRHCDIASCPADDAQAVDPLMQGDLTASVMLPDESFLQDTGLLQSSSPPSLFLGDKLIEDPTPFIPAPLGTGTTVLDFAMLQSGSKVGSDRGTEQSISGVEDGRARTEQQDGGSSSDGGMSTHSATQNNGDIVRTESGRESSARRKRSGSQSESCAKRARGWDETEGKLEGKELRAALRKQRNREAAAKSNVKRKIRNEALRRDLAEVSKRATELRAMEKVLREENVRLRVLATERKFNVSAHLTHIQIARS